MKRVLATAVLGLVLLNAGVSFGQIQPKELPAIMVLSVKNEEAASPGLANILTNLILQDLDDMKRFRVIGQKDVNQMLSGEQQKQLAGCKDTGCLVEIAGAMGTRYTIDSTVGVVGSSNVISLSLIDVTKATVVSRKTTVVKGENEQLLGIVHKLITELMEPVLAQGSPIVSPVHKVTAGEEKPGVHPPPKPAFVPGNENPPLPAPPSTINVSKVEEKPNPSAPPQATKAVKRRTDSYKVWGHVCFWSGLALAGTGGVFTALSISAADDYAKGTNMMGSKDSIERFDALAVAGYITGGALMATGIVLWLVSPSEGASTGGRPIIVAPVIASDGGGLAVSGIW